MDSKYIKLVNAYTWGGGDTPIKFSVGYLYARDLSDGKVTYNIAVDIDPLPNKNGNKFGYPIYGQVYIRNGAVPWTSVEWITGNGANNVYTFKKSTADDGPLTWSTALSNNTKNVKLTANPGDNVQLMVHLYSSSSLPDRNIVFLWGRGVPDESTKQVSSKSTVVSSTPLTVPAPAGASLSAVPILTISGTGSQNLNFTCANLIASYYYRLTATLNGVVIRTHEFVKGQSSGTITVTFASENIEAALNAMPTSANGDMQYELITYSDSNHQTRVGQPSYMTGKCTIDKTSIKPNVTGLTYTCLKGDETWKLDNIQNITHLRLDSVTAESSLGASIGYYVATLGTGSSSKSYTFSVTPANIPFEIAGDALQLSIKAYDSREAPSVEYVAGNFRVHEYHTPQISAYSAERCDGGGNPTQDGSYFSVDATLDISDVAMNSMVCVDPGSAIVNLPSNNSYIKLQNKGINHTIDNSTGAFATFFVSNNTSASDYTNTTIDITILNTQARTNFYLRDSNDTTLYSGGATRNNQFVYSFDLSSSGANPYNLSVDYNVNSSKVLTVYCRLRDSMSSPQMSVAYKPTSSSTYGAADTRNVTSESFSGVFGGQMLTDTSYDLRYTLSDRFSTQGVTVQDYLSSAEYTLFLAKGGKAISVGEVYAPAEGSDEKVLNIADDWEIRRGGGDSGGGVVPPYVTEYDVVEHIPTGAVNPDITWTYRKWSNGFVELWGTSEERTVEIINFRSWGSVYLSGGWVSDNNPNDSDAGHWDGVVTEAYTYPLIFNATPNISTTFQATNPGNGWLVTAQTNMAHNPDVTQATPRYFVARAANTIQVQFRTHYYITGFEATS